MRPYLEKTLYKKGLVEWLKVEALSSSPSTAGKKTKNWLHVGLDSNCDQSLLAMGLCCVHVSVNLKFCLFTFGAGDQIPGVVRARQVFYHGVTSLALTFMFSDLEKGEALTRFLEDE
jgi:hypothetical protein